MPLERRSLAELAIALPSSFPVPEDVCVRFVQLDALAHHVGAMVHLLDAEELARAGGMRNPRRALAFMGGRALAKLMLSEACGKDRAPGSFRIVVDAAGKPGAASDPAAISIAHTDTLLGVAVKQQGAVGLDVERLGTAPSSLLAEHLHPAEREILASLPRQPSDEAFLRLWTAKEAVAKCHGTGVDLATADVSAVLAGSNPFHAGGLCLAVRPLHLQGAGEFMVAVAWN